MNIRNFLKWTLLLVAFLAYKQMDFGQDTRSDDVRYLSPAEERR